MKPFKILLLVALLSSSAGCASMFVSGHKTDDSPWQSYEEAQIAFDRIMTNQTTMAELKKLGYDPFETPNVKILTYLDLQQRFLTNPSLSKADLSGSVKEALEARERCRGYELQIACLRNKRYGNLFLDITGFKKQTRESGWTFYALIVLRDDTVIYKLQSGQPRVNRSSSSRKPLGPFQDLESLISGLPKAL
jgi:hypothetical protein